MRYIADGMLGRFSRWLRLLGQDVKFLNDTNDDELLKLTRTENRILLTRDVLLYRRAIMGGIEAFLVEGDSEAEKLARFAKRFGVKLEVDTTISRCPTCNSPIKRVSKDLIKGKVPENTLNSYDDFYICTDAQCQKIYWKGSHWKHINKILATAKQILKSQKS